MGSDKYLEQSALAQAMSDPLYNDPLYNLIEESRAWGAREAHNKELENEPNSLKILRRDFSTHLATETAAIRKVRDEMAEWGSNLPGRAAEDHLREMWHRVGKWRAELDAILKERE